MYGRYKQQVLQILYQALLNIIDEILCKNVLQTEFIFLYARL